MNLAFARLVRTVAVSFLFLTAGMASTLAVRVPHWAAPYNEEAVPWWLAAGALLAYLTEDRRSVGFVSSSRMKKKSTAQRIDELMASSPAGGKCQRCGATMIHYRLYGYRCTLGCELAEYRTPARESPPNVTGKPPVA